MRTWAKGSAPMALLAVGVMTLGNGTALADTSGNGSVGGGNQVRLPINLPVDISGNSVAAAGRSAAGSHGGATVVDGGGSEGGNSTSGDRSVLGGNQVVAPINAPVGACGNAVAVLGRAAGACSGGARVEKAQGRQDGHGDGAGGNVTSGKNSVLGGNQVVAPINAPISLCGNPVAIFGGAAAGCVGGASVRNTGGAPSTHARAASSKSAAVGAGDNHTSGRFSVLGGNQVIAPITAPINVCGNAAAVAGRAFAACQGGAKVKNGGRSSGRGAGGNTTSGRWSVGGGNQVVAPITAPIDVCGNAAAVAGRSFAACKGGAVVKNGGRSSGAGGNRTSGIGSVAGGNQVVAPINAPVSACGITAAVLGDAAAGCLGGAKTGHPGGGGGYGGDRQSRGWWTKVLPKHQAGLVSDRPVVPAGGGVTDSGNFTQPVRDSWLPALPFSSGAKGLPEGAPEGLTEMAGLPGLPALPRTPSVKHQSAADGKHNPSVRRSSDELPPVSGVTGANPAEGALRQATRGLPIGQIGLMSAAQPTGLTGMSAGSLLALVVGAMFAASATLFATTRRLRLRRK